MVQNVLGVAAEMKVQSQVEQHSPATADAAAVQTEEVPAAPVTQKDAKPVATMNQENSYLKGIDFGMEAQPTRPPSSAQDNSYLHGMSLSNVGKSSSSENYLASFSWDDELPSAKAKVSRTSSVRADDKKPSAPKKNALLAWLAPKQQHTATKPPAPASSEQENSYHKDLDLN